MAPNLNGIHPADPLGPPTRAIILGYYDGPTAGLIQFGGGPAYHFEMPDEDRQLAGDDGTREYVLCPLPVDALDRLEAAIGRYLTPDRPVWLPRWQFPTPAAERETDAAVEVILAEKGPPEWVVEANDITRRVVSARPAGGREAVAQPVGG